MDSQGTTVEVSPKFGEEFRPRFHFTPERNWMNDPNGLLFYKGKYHLFYQHNPEGNLWGNMSWGHAVSTDLFNWEHLPIAISYNAEFGIFSGSAVVDHTNTTGFGSIEKPAMVAIFTAARHDETHQSQHLAYSVDEGITWQPYEGNPVLDESMKDFRDPKVTWDASSDTWLMTIAKPEEHKIAFYRSADLMSWKHLSDFGPLAAIDGCWECPDLFPLTGPDGSIYWILLVSLNPGGVAGGSGTQYFIGHWDGTTFSTSQTTALWLDYGRDNYAGVTFNDVPNGEKIFLGWMSNWLYARDIPTEIWRSSMTLPRRLELAAINTELQLISQPIAPQEQNLERYFIDCNQDCSITFTTESGSVEINFNKNNKRLTIDRSNAWLVGVIEEPQQSQEISAESFVLEIFFDHGSIELFAPSIALSMTSLHMLHNDAIKIATLGAKTFYA
jgi:levanase/fructan beta-fructosidase